MPLTVLVFGIMFSFALLRNSIRLDHNRRAAVRAKPPAGHAACSLRRFTDQPLGLFSTAECFVFVSAFLAGMLFRKRAEKLGFAAARSSSIHRAGRIYRAHLVTLFFAFVLGSFFLSELPGVRNLLDRYLVNPLAGIGSSPVLLFRPPLMDILPMYILFSLLTPAAFGAPPKRSLRSLTSSGLNRQHRKNRRGSAPG
jgi:hypothetical protein